MGVKFEKVSKGIQIYPEAFKRKVVEDTSPAPVVKWIICASMASKQKAAYKGG